jgi:hypothetical protein
MKNNHRHKIEEIIGEIKCPYAFRCCKSEFQDVCNARDIGIESFLECLDKEKDCKFAFSFGQGHLCKCPLRVYIAKELKK